MPAASLGAIDGHFVVSPSPHGLSDPDFDATFTCDKLIIFAFHGYPAKAYIEKHGEDMPEIRNWKWGIATGSSA